MKSQTRYRGSIQKPIQSMENQEEHASFNIKQKNKYSDPSCTIHTYSLSNISTMRMKTHLSFSSWSKMILVIALPFPEISQQVK